MVVEEGEVALEKPVKRLVQVKDKVEMVEMEFQLPWEILPDILVQVVAE